MNIHSLSTSSQATTTTTTTRLSIPRVPLFFCVTCGGKDLSGQPMVARAYGAAQRRKLRRLRAGLRHEQQSIAMALASALHHSADKTTRAQHNAPRGQRNAGTEYYMLSDEEDVVPARGPGHPVWVSRGRHRTGISCAPWSRLPIMPPWCRFWVSCAAVGGTVAERPSFLPHALVGGCRADLEM